MANTIFVEAITNIKVDNLVADDLTLKLDYGSFCLELNIPKVVEKAGDTSSIGLDEIELGLNIQPIASSSTVHSEMLKLVENWNLLCRNSSRFEAVSSYGSSGRDKPSVYNEYSDQCNSVMTAYKLVTVDALYWGFGSKLENALLAGERALFLESHRNCFAWIDEWFGLSMEVMRKLEYQSDSSLNQVKRLKL
ncbi:phosphatidylinositol transfer 1-like [Olea europaea subsp. europaea]|uniref:Phosphatidylinositol transfer 1-like n=1 Tax=Olea europaea subsp. europaea TaxID=158383 RepID=A0A8S0T8R2_OLEEU|nr:phosphatidylinositol transfer 1-like [Olea europaea subsp. europaea]